MDPIGTSCHREQLAGLVMRLDAGRQAGVTEPAPNPSDIARLGCSAFGSSLLTHRPRLDFAVFRYDLPVKLTRRLRIRLPKLKARKRDSRPRQFISSTQWSPYPSADCGSLVPAENWLDHDREASGSR